MVLRSLNHDLERCSSSFTLGRTQARLVLRSLNHDLFTINDVETLDGMLHTLATEVVDGSVEAPLVALDTGDASDIVTVCDAQAQTAARFTAQLQISLTLSDLSSMDTGSRLCEHEAVMPGEHVLRG